MKDDLDLLLDRSLETYSAVEPSPDLAEAILRRSQTAAAGLPAKRRRRIAWTFALAVPATALILVVMLAVRFGLPHSSLAPKFPERAEQIPAPLQLANHQQTNQMTRESDAVTKASLERPRVSHRVAKSKERAPERDFYVVPASPEERALVEFVQQHPQEAAAIAEQQKHALDPLREDPIVVAPIEIKPITIAAID
jgi:hypothetical protein